MYENDTLQELLENLKIMSQEAADVATKLTALNMQINWMTEEIEKRIKQINS